MIRRVNYLAAYLVYRVIWC